MSSGSPHLQPDWPGYPSIGADTDTSMISLISELRREADAATAEAEVAGVVLLVAIQVVLQVLPNRSSIVGAVTPGMGSTPSGHRG